MTGDSLNSLIRASQGDSGAFPAIAHLLSGPVPDENGFVTALFVDLLGKVASDVEIEAARQRGVDFLLRCERPDRPGAFGFYPVDAHPPWLGQLLPADADDTALISHALFRAGRRERKTLGQGVREVLGHYRLNKRPLGASWFRAGVYPTWLDAAIWRNPIDVCANVNVAVLIEESGESSEHGRGGIMEMAEAALNWVGGSPDRVRILTPYYPHPAELGHALERAVAVGIPRATDLLRRAKAQAWIHCEDPMNTPICSSFGGRLIWTSPVLQAIRRRV